jgi:hypothetical protein
VVITLSLSVIRPWSRASVEIIVGPSAERDEPALRPNTTGRHFRRRSEPEVASAAGKAPRDLIVGRLFDVLDKKSLQPHREGMAQNIGTE